MHTHTRVGEAVPGLGAEYKASDTPVLRTRAKAADEHFKFLRGGSCQSATLELKNANLHPATVLKHIPGAGVASWNNYADTLYTFLVHYCIAEGLTRTDGMVRKVMLYLFHGKYMYRAKKNVYLEKPIIQGVHYKVTNGRSRFVKDVVKNFATLIKLLQDKPSLKPLLEDEGVAQAPPEYLAAVEEGLRAYGENVYAMGCGAIKSRFAWLKVETWRKREAYITVVRYVNKKPTYKKWTCFRWEDYTHRLLAGKTFHVRHEPLTSSCNVSYEPHLADPPHWNAASDIPYPKQYHSKTTTPPKKKRKKTKKTLKSAPKSSRAPVVMKFNPETNQFYCEP